MSKQLSNYVQALMPDPHIILGVRLRPFCLGHYFLMERFDCGFSSENPEQMGGIEDLLLAVAICSRTFEDFLDFISDGKEFFEWSEQWGKAVSKELESNKDYNLLEKIGALKAYMRDNIKEPAYVDTDLTEEATPSGAHWTQSVLSILMSEGGYTQSEALNLPLSRALFDYYKIAEKHGLVSLLDDYELESTNKI